MAGRISSSGSTTATQESPVNRKSFRAFGQTAGDSTGTAGSRKSQHSDRPGHAAAGSASERLARLEAIMRGENPLDRNRALLAFIDQLGPGDFEAAVAQFRAMGITDSRFGEYALLLSAWAKADPLAALDYAKGNTAAVSPPTRFSRPGPPPIRRPRSVGRKPITKGTARTPIWRNHPQHRRLDPDPRHRSS